MRRLRAQNVSLTRGNFICFRTLVYPVCSVALDVDHDCSFYSSSSADIPEFMALKRAVVYYSAKKMQDPSTGDTFELLLDA